MKIEELSKQKYIWRVYMSADDKIHMEKRPIVYVNSKYVYYKDARRMLLEWVHVESINDCLTNKSIDSILYGAHVWFWQIDDDMQTVLTDVKTAKRVRDEKKAIEKIKAEYADAQRRLERAKQAYDKLPDSEKV